jgi:hypothetical protein
LSDIVEGSFEGLDGTLRLDVITLEAFSGGTTPALYRFSLSCMILSGTAHGVLLHLRG